ncbi:TRAP transporter large permease subunit [Thermodesulfobacteriota bacterium]
MNQLPHIVVGIFGKISLGDILVGGTIPGILMLINFEMGMTTPPFGMMLFVMKGVAPPEITIKDICYAALPFILCDMVAMAMIIIWPQIVLWLPGLVAG